MLNAILTPWIHSHNHYDSPHPLHTLITMNWFHKLVSYLQANINKKHHRTFLISQDHNNWTINILNSEPKHRCISTSTHVSTHNRTPNSAKQFAKAIAQNRRAQPKQPSPALQRIQSENRICKKTSLRRPRTSVREHGHTRSCA